eukprot:EG_transcript_56374
MSTRTIADLAGSATFPHRGVEGYASIWTQPGRHSRQVKTNVLALGSGTPPPESQKSVMFGAFSGPWITLRGWSTSANSNMSKCGLKSNLNPDRGQEEASGDQEPGGEHGVPDGEA